MAAVDNIDDLLFGKTKKKKPKEPGLYEGIKTPEFKPVEYEKATAQEVGPWERVESSFQDVQTKAPELRQRQTQSIDALDRLAASGGMTLADKANFARQQQAVATADRGRREAIQQKAASQGMTGSGNTLIAQLASSQAATNRAAQTGADLAGQARQRALQATMQSGQLAGQVRGQDFGEEATRAQALDAISKFNVQGRMSAEQFNSAQRQATELFNTQTGNRQQDALNAQLQQAFMNSMALEDGKAQMYMAELARLQSEGDRDARRKAGITSGLFTIGGALIGGYMGGPGGAAAGATAGSQLAEGQG